MTFFEIYSLILALYVFGATPKSCIPGIPCSPGEDGISRSPHSGGNRKRCKMADFRYIRPNRLRQEAKRRRLLLLVIGLPITIAGAWIHLLILGIGAVALAVLWDRQNRRLSGAEGEEQALGVPHARAGSLAYLPDTYTVFNQVAVPYGKRYRELDLIVVGPNGIFVIEVKHYRGVIAGAESDRTWRQCQYAHDGGDNCERSVRNPVLQLQHGVRAIRRYLAARDIKTWVQGAVVMTHPDCRLDVSTTDTPVITLPQIAGYILNYRPRWAPRKLGPAIPLIRQLLEAECHAQPPLRYVTRLREQPRAP